MTQMILKIKILKTFNTYKMKNKKIFISTLLTTLLFMLSSFQNQQPEQPKNGYWYRVHNSNNAATLSVAYIDNCEYIVACSGTGVAIVHKQNCKNHKY